MTYTEEFTANIPHDPGQDADRALAEAKEETTADNGRRRAWPRYEEAVMGLRNYWYPAFFSNELEDGETRAETICGERIMFKRVDGEVYAIEDRCIHRGVPLSARPECHSKNTVTCWLHGFTFDVRDGKVVQILSHPESKLVNRVSIPTYKVRELASTVFVYIGDGEPEPIEHDLPPLMRRSEIDGDFKLAWRPLVRIKINGNWRTAAENGFDDPHIWLHHDADLVTRGDIAVPLGMWDRPQDRILREEDGHPKGVEVPAGAAGIGNMTWRVMIEDQEIAATVPPAMVEAMAKGEPMSPTDVKYIEEIMEISSTTATGCWLPGFFMGGFGFPRMDLAHFEWYVPIDEDHHMYTILYAGLVKNDEDEADFHARMDEYGPLVFSVKDANVIGFNNADVFGREEIHHAYANEDWLSRERLFAADGGGVLLWRKMVDKHARAIQPKKLGFRTRPRPEESEVFYTDEEHRS
ncbi:Rieske 2Fe-2S domain-containing protein [Gordonia terrae]|uniref:Rieske 2Fe-2S domain-containing protein n=1 Tax=Gordonia terrae TaxID=2055 RepID=UPI003F6D50BA